MQDRTRGHLFVAVQLLILVALALPARETHWRVPAWLEVLGFATLAAGAVLLASAGSRLGRALTASPVPKVQGELVTTGLYAHVRHPIYSGVLAIVLGLALRSGNAVTVGVGLAALVFFRIKAGWEERLLRERYPDYDEYAKRTPRFVPRLR